ncbi:PepSY-associated TM helix domain-containing protein [Marinibacterium sp. SX1]|uniref:PepSY-associated TM helix domain-containing protein n=1 Tax=Marinibacterium sp. SX1 TaxID=3388424 RepID=UPI003D183927
MVTTNVNVGARETVAPAAASKLYFAAWRWHFYAGLYVIPFFLMLAVTGLCMLWIAHLGGRDGERITVVPGDAPMALSQQAAAARDAVPGGRLMQYIAPREADRAAVFRVDTADGAAMMVAVDPYAANVIDSWPRRNGAYDLADRIHGELMLGVTGDRMVEIAASLGMVLVASGLYLWWPRNGRSWRDALLPRLGRGRSMWKSLHGAVGFWLSIVLVFFLVSGLSWAGIWGEKMMQAWNQFPAEKWGAPLSHANHGSLTNGPKDVPWTLELTPLPLSGSVAGAEGVAEGLPLTIDVMDRFAREIGFETGNGARFQMNLPQGHEGVWTFSRDSMSTDSLDPTADRTVHVDRHTGRILADVRYDDYSLYGKAMAVGIALHMGTLGLWSVLANTVFCLAVIGLCISAVVMWWIRRPAGAGRLAAPPMPRDMPLWQGARLVGLAVSLAFPMAGLTILAVLALDTLVLQRLPGLRQRLS